MGAVILEDVGDENATALVQDGEFTALDVRGEWAAAPFTVSLSKFSEEDTERVGHTEGVVACALRYAEAGHVFIIPLPSFSAEQAMASRSIGASITVPRRSPSALS